MTERNWQEDMKLSEQAKGWTYEITFNGEGNIVAKDANYTFAQVIAGDVGISNAEVILDGLEALPYWLQQYAAAESLIQQKDAEISAIKSMLLDAIGCLTMFGNEKCEEEARRIARDLRKLTHVQSEHVPLLHHEGDKL